MAANGNITTEQFRLQIPEQFLGSLEVLSSPDPDYDLSEEELAGQSLTDRPIYQKLYIIDHARLLEDKDDVTGAPVIRVMGGGAQIGQIRREDTAHLTTILTNFEIVSTEVSVTGGPWKKVTVSDDGEAVLTEGESSPAGTVTVYYTQKENTPVSSPAPAPAASDDTADAVPDTASSAQTQSSDDDNVGGWIDTSYVTELREKNPADYGMSFLFFSAILSVCYLCFALPCWITGRSAEFFKVLTIGGLSLTEPVLLFHLITLGGALICNIIGIFLAGSTIPALAALLYAFSGLMLPGYLFCTGLQSLLCIFAALRKRKGPKSVKAVLIIASAALLALEVYQYVEKKILFNPFGEVKTGTSAATDDDEYDFMDDDLYMDESEFDEFWDEYEEDEFESDFYDEFEDDSEMFPDDVDFEEDFGGIDMGVEGTAGNPIGELPSPLGGAAGLAGLSPRN